MKRLLRFLLAAAALLAAWFLVFQLRKDPEGAFLVRWSGPSPIPAGAQCVALGEGLVDVKGCVGYLRDTGYDGAVSLETEGGDDFGEICLLAKKSFDYLRALDGCGKEE